MVRQAMTDDGTWSGRAQEENCGREASSPLVVRVDLGYKGLGSDYHAETL